MQTYREAMKRPLRMLPLEVQETALRFWTCYRFLSGMEEPVSLAARLSVWIDTYELLVGDAVAILDSMLSPSVASAFQSSWALMGELATRVKVRLDQRQSEAAADRRRNGEPPASPEEQARIRAMIADLGRCA
jgi:hypothetical protein